MSLSIAEKKRFRRIGHELSPVILTGGSGVTEGVLAETDRALEDHELIKVRVNGEDREERAAAIQMIAARTKSQIVQSIGKVVLLYRPARKPNAKLSNLLRYNHLQN
ncbi:MAG: ribosome assembly RNA-binding protein YhbY [Moraxellaceae bacterium]|jgi:RNA-binding protein|nr:ribosome assembly RNA-binding protein YhbY [Moraxellaceae bacterium]MBP8853377.1 ribosome assembly RNA-binding protein YhbY [Moraxellaceae bacterium]MBP9044881.1 ribosome assembly RNA-binding protein YhbY [Moraxellaceae bacterium]MBP9730268.1 ribosome assembly RNA-binding protein YhbY [Moraxellaceae bacterium]MCC6200419.1 ribosome assembly RNA-binding protein YhbY [Moraxellaceae bacterium]